MIDRRGAVRLLAEERILSHNLIVGAGTVLAGVMGVAFQSLASHQLKPADYGGVFVVVTLISFIGLPAGAFMLLMARDASLDRANATSDRTAALLAGGNRALLLAGLAIGLVMAAGSPFLGPFLGTTPSLIVAGALGVPFAVALPLLLGTFQGQQRFGAFATLSAGQAALKLAAAILLGLVFGPIGVVAGISVASVVAYAAAWLLLAPARATDGRTEWWGRAWRYLAVVVPGTLALSVLLSTDVVIVKHYFGAREAGEYAAVAALGRAIFWGASGVAAVLFPKVVYRAASSQRASLVVSASLVLVVVGGLAGMAALSVLSAPLIKAFAGPAYVGGAAYLPWYAIGMTFLGATAVLIATHQSHGRPGYLVALLPLVAVEPVLLVAVHQSLIQVVAVVDISLALPALGLLAWLGVEQRINRQAARFEPSVVIPQMEAVGK